MKKLELKQLAPYLPYVLGFVTVHGKHVDLRFSIDGCLKYSYSHPMKAPNVKRIKQDSVLKNYKPILRPLSDLTNEIKHNGEKFIPADRFKTFVLCDVEIINKQGVLSLKFPTGNKLCFINNEILAECHYGFYEFLTMYHFDVFGLIEEGLAIDINEIK
jgi:hypothetical protein